MASPQLENGFMQIAQELVRQFSRADFAGREWKIIWALFGKTWAWHKKEEMISLTEFSEATGLTTKKCSEVLADLTRRNVIKQTLPKNGDKRCRCYCFNKDYEVWQVKYSPKTGIVPEKGDHPPELVPENGEITPRKGGLISDINPLPDSENGTPKDTPIKNKELKIGVSSENSPQKQGAIKEKKSRKKPAVPLPPDFKLNADRHVYAVSKGMPAGIVSLEWERFIESHRKKDSYWSDWNAAWKTWVLNWVKWEKNPAEAAMGEVKICPKCGNPSKRGFIGRICLACADEDFTRK